MPDYGFIANPQQQDSFKTIRSMMDMAGSVQNLQRGNIQLQQERALMQPNIELGKAASATAQTGAQSADLGLKQKQQGVVSDVLGGLLQDPRIRDDNPDGIVQALAEARKQIVARGVPEANAEWGISLLQSKAHEPGAVTQAIQNLIRQATGSTSQASVINAPLSPVSTGAGTEFAQLQPGAPNAVTPISGAPAAGQPQPTFIPAGVPPSNVEAKTADALGRPVIEVTAQNGVKTYKAPPDTSYKPIMQLPPGETSQSGIELLNLRNETQKQASNIGEQHFLNQEIGRLSDEGFTGAGSGALSKALGSVGLNWIPGDKANNTYVVQHFLAMQTQSRAAAAGANTDQQQALAAQAVLPPNAPADAIKRIVKINDALVTAADLKNQGMAKAISHPDNTKDIYAVRDFQNAWTQNFDPNVMRIINAQKSGDAGELAAIKKELGANGLKALIPKYQALKSLYETGR